MEDVPPLTLSTHGPGGTPGPQSPEGEHNDNPIANAVFLYPQVQQLCPALRLVPPVPGRSTGGDLLGQESSQCFQSWFYWNSAGQRGSREGIDCPESAILPPGGFARGQREP